jgi:hypothetical protein
VCGREIEIFSVDTHVVCECGFVAYNDTQSCIRWCRYARECVGKIFLSTSARRSSEVLKVRLAFGAS